jgi:hypothetical protein
MAIHIPDELGGPPTVVSMRVEDLSLWRGKPDVTARGTFLDNVIEPCSQCGKDIVRRPYDKPVIAICNQCVEPPGPGVVVAVLGEAVVELEEYFRQHPSRYRRN